MNEIWIRGLRVPVFIGVPDEERQSRQEVVVDLCVEPSIPFADLADDITKTIDYAALADRVVALAAGRPRHLIETLAVEIADLAIREFAARSATVEIRKFILPQTDHVAVRFRRDADPGGH